ncbi:MAG: cation:proton antiporter [Desulfuromonadaceae bacterium]
MEISSPCSDATTILLTFGGLFLIGLLADIAGKHTPLPRVTLLLLAGFVIGPSCFDLLPQFIQECFSILTKISLAMIGFLLGQHMTMQRMRELGRSVLTMSASEVLMTAFMIAGVLSLFGVPLHISLLLAGIAPATAPAATVDVVHEYSARGRFTNTLLGIVAIDDAWGLFIFSVMLAAAQAIHGGGGITEAMISGAWEIVGALILGLVLGVPMAYITGRIRSGEPTQAEALGVVLICAGLAVWFDVSYILAAMVMGSIVANFAYHHERPFNAIEGIEWPFLILFFLLAGASLHMDALIEAGWLAAGYIILRVLGRVGGVWLGGLLCGAERNIRTWLGLTLLPQAGVAIGMALLAAQRFPESEDIILPVVLGATVIFEVAGPAVTRMVLTHVGDIKSEDRSA